MEGKEKKLSKEDWTKEDEEKRRQEGKEEEK
jgi:hypothetical protein